MTATTEGSGLDERFRTKPRRTTHMLMIEAIEACNDHRDQASEYFKQLLIKEGLFDEFVNSHIDSDLAAAIRGYDAQRRLALRKYDVDRQRLATKSTGTPPPKISPAQRARSFMNTFKLANDVLLRDATKEDIHEHIAYVEKGIRTGAANIRWLRRIADPLQPGQKVSTYYTDDRVEQIVEHRDAEFAKIEE